jgi:hypothetical protein
MNYNLTHITALLTQLGLSETQKQLYLSGLETGPMSISDLSKTSWIGRINTHVAVQSMIDQWIFLETYYGKRRLVYPAMSEWLQQLIDEKSFQIKQLQTQLDASKSVFDYISTSRASLTNTRLYSGIEGINTALLEIARDRKAVSIIYDANSLGWVIDEKLFHWSYSERSKHKTKTRLILPSWFKDYRHVEWKEDYDVSIKTLADNQIFQGGIEIWGHKVALHCYREGRITTTIIENQEIAQILLIMYDAMRKWAKDYQEQYLLV